MSKPLVRRIETSTGHWYANDKDQPIPGVTSVLKCLPKEALQKWQLRKAVDLALAGESKWDWDGRGSLTDYLVGAGDREANTAAAIGTNAHEFAEHWMLGKNPDIEALAKKERKHADCFLHFVRDYQPEPVLVEKVLTYIDPKTNQPLYCGTMDLIAKLYWDETSDLKYLPNDWVDGETWILDYKASSSMVRSSHALQASAYRYSTHYIDEDGQLQEMLPVDHGAVILLNGGTGNRCFRMQKVDTSPVVFSVFKSLLRIHNFMKIEDRIILGEM